MAFGVLQKSWMKFSTFKQGTAILEIHYHQKWQILGRSQPKKATLQKSSNETESNLQKSWHYENYEIKGNKNLSIPMRCGILNAKDRKTLKQSTFWDAFSKFLVQQNMSHPLTKQKWILVHDQWNIYIVLF